MEEKRDELKVRSYLFSLRMIKYLRTLNQRDLTTEVIVKQVLRSATSVGANVAEARGSSSKKDFAKFFGHALKSANETKFWLGLLRDSKISKSEIINPLIQEAKELSNMLGASIATIRKSS